MISMPRKEAKRIKALQWIVTQLTAGARLTEVQMNAELRPIFDDVAMLRRYLVDYRLVERPEPGIYVIPEASAPSTPTSQ